MESSEASEREAAASVGRRRRARVELTANSPSAKVRRILVLAGRFQAMASLRSDPARLIDLLRSIVSLARDTFRHEASREPDALSPGRMNAEQLRCVRDLELLLQGLAHGSAEAWRGIGHAMDALLIQCVLFDTAIDAAEALAAPSDR